MPSAFYHVHDPAVHAYHLPGGEVYNLIWEVTSLGSTLAKMYTGKRTGKLMRSIQGNRPSQRGGYAVAGLLYANAKHALWHHEGTPTIFPKKGRRYLTIPRGHSTSTVSGGQLRKEWMSEGSARGAKPYFLARSISGQKGNPYLKDGLEEAMGRDTRLTITAG